MSGPPLENPYWDVVKDRIDPTGSLWRTPCVDSMNLYRSLDGQLDFARLSRDYLNRSEYVSTYAWTITDPATVEFVAAHSHGRRLVDPMAGTGYWGWLLAQLGLDVLCYDKQPPSVGCDENQWHRNTAAHCHVHPGEAVDVVQRHPNHTLLLSWPPYGFDAAPVLGAYPGDRVIYMGEGEGGCCGDDGLFRALNCGWSQVAGHVPVQWDGIHDLVQIYDRLAGAA